LHKPIRRKFARRRVTVNGVDNIWSADLVDMQALAKYNDGVKYLLNVIDVFSKYAWSVPLKDKTGKSIVIAFEAIIKRCDRKPDMLWVDRGSEFYKRVVDNWLERNNISRYSTFNEGKAVVIERFNRTLKANMWWNFSANNTHRYIDTLDQLIDEYNNTKHGTIKLTPTEGSEKANELLVTTELANGNSMNNRPKFKVGDKVRISKYKRLFEKGYTPNWTEEIFEVAMFN